MLRHTPGRNSERGSFVAVLALMIPIFIGIFGLVFDAGTVYALKREMQTSADAAALAAMHEMRAGNDTGYSAAALEDAALNGFTESQGGTSVDVNRPPLHGARAGDDAFIEVVIRQDKTLPFMKALGKQSTEVVARATAGLIPLGTCVIALNPSASKAIWATGNSDLIAPNCSIQADSTHSNALVTNGGATIVGSAINTAGGYSGSGFTPTPGTGAPVMGDPFEDLPAPSFGGCNYTNKVVKKNENLYPGVYCGGLTLNAKGNAFLNPGMYVLRGGGLTLRGSSEIEGDGVTFFLTAGGGYGFGPVDFAGNSEADLRAPNSGTYKGILFFKDRNVSSSAEHKFVGTSDSKFQGVLYLPGSPMKFAGNTGITADGTMIVADTIVLHGTAGASALATAMSPPSLNRARIVE